MTTYSLDTNIVADFLNRPMTSPASEKIRRMPLATLIVSSVVMQELFFGAHNGSVEKLPLNLGRIRALPFATTPFDDRDAEATGEVRAVLKAKGLPIDAADLMIAGQALARGLIVVTRNLRHFSRVPGLHLENWLAP
jgi:tRNA(fMet)-specific endonuclease VapC